MTKLSNRLLLLQNARYLVDVRGICQRYVVQRQMVAHRLLSLPYYKISPKFLFSSDLATNFRIRLYLRSASDHFTTDSLISCVSTPSCVKKRYPHHTNSTRTYELLWAFPAVFSTSRTVRDGYGEALSNAQI